MIINKISSSQNFKGFKNVISNTINSGNSELSYIAMTLDNQETNDLEQWENLQKQWFKSKPTTPFLFAHSIMVPDGHIFAINNKCINLDLAQNKKEEQEFLKAYTQLASLTNRIGQKAFHPEDNKLKVVFIMLKDYLTQILDNPELAHILTFEAAKKRDKSFITARNMNNQIAKVMKTYFKV